MKKILLLSLLSLTLYSCSNDEDNQQKELQFIQVRVTSEGNVTPSGNVYLFRISGYDIKNYEPNCWIWEDTPLLFYKNRNGESDFMTPISDYGHSYSGKLLKSPERNCSLHAIYWDDLKSTYGKPKAGDEYLLLVNLSERPYSRAYKRLILTENSKITVTLPPTDTGYSDFVEASWKIEPYTSDFE